MNVLLINSPVALMSPHARISPPLGLAYLAAYLRQHGHGVEVLDFNVSGLNPRRLDLAISRLEPALVGISAMTETYPNALKIARIVKEIAPEVSVVLGGAHPSIVPKDVLAEPEVDFVIAGEGEEGLTRLAEALESGDSSVFAGIPGLAYAESDGTVRVNPRATPRDPDSFPLPARDLLPLDFYGDAFNVLTARGGCPHRCPFCSASFIWHGRHRARSPKAVVDEVELLAREYGARFVFFVDDIFTLSRRWTLDFLREMERLRGAVTWGCATRVDRVDAELLGLMAAAGCTGIQFGIESGAQEILDNVKGIDKDTARSTVRASVDAGITTSVSFMAPFPEDTESTLAETFAFIEELVALGAEPLLSFTTPFPGTLFYEKADELGVKVLTDDWELFDCKHVIMETRHLSAEKIERIVAEGAQRLGLSRSA